MLNISDNLDETAEFFFGTQGNGNIGIGTSPGSIAGAVQTGGGSGVSDDLKSIMNNASLSAPEALEILSQLTTNSDGMPFGVDGVELAAVTDTSFVLEITSKRGATDTITINHDGNVVDDRIGADAAGPGLGLLGQNAGNAESVYAVINDGESIIGTKFLGRLDADYDVGGVLSGEAETITILEAAIDKDFDAVELLNVDTNSFTITIESNLGKDTYTFVGSNAEAALDSIASDRVNPGDKKDAFVFLEGGESGTLGIGTSGRFGGEFGGVLSVNELIDFVMSGDEAPGVKVTDLGDATMVELDGNAGSVDTVIIDDSFFGAYV